MNMQLFRQVDAAFALDRAFTANPTAAAYPSLVPTATRPAVGTDTGVFALNRWGQGASPRRLLVLGTANANNATFNLRVTAWKRVGSGLWLPYTVAELLFTAGNIPGVTGSADLAATEFVADTVSVVSNHGSADDVFFFSPADDTPAHAVIDPKGAELVQFTLKTGTATSMNALWGVL